jgi:hypothetical protein
MEILRDFPSHRIYSLVATEWILQESGTAPELIERVPDPTRTLVLRAVTPADFDQPPSEEPMLEGNDGSMWPLGSVALHPEELRKIPFSQVSNTCHLCEISYLNPRDIILEPKAVIADQIEGFPTYVEATTPSVDGSAYMWLDGLANELTVVFRGTGSLWDSICLVDETSEFITKVHPFEPKGRVNTNLLDQLATIDVHIRPIIDSKLELIDRIIITGHDSGGAIATLASPYLAEVYADKEIVCMTFGAPRVGNYNFVRFFNSRVRQSYRITDCYDPTPSLPYLDPFTHPHESICTREDGLVRYAPEIGAVDRREINPIEDFVNSIRYSVSHNPEEYSRRIDLVCQFISAAAPRGA